MKKNLAIYPGSFNPFTIGHLSILKKAEEIFDEVIVAIGINPDKKVDEKINRLETLKFQLPNKKIEEFSGFLVDYVHKKEEEGYNVTVVRGLRNGADLDSEINQLRVLEDQYPKIKMIFIPCDRKYEHISSSMVRTMEKIQEGSASEYLVKPEMFGWDKNNTIKIGETTFKFQLPKGLYMDSSVTNYMNDWTKIVEESKKEKDEWVELECVPGYKLKGLRCSEYDLENLSIKFEINGWEKIDIK